MTLFKGHILKSLRASGIWLITCLLFFKGQKIILINSCQGRWLGRRKNHRPKYTALTQTHLESRATILIIQEISENWISICHCQNMSLVSSVIFIIIVIIILSLLLISYYNYCYYYYYYYYYCCCCCYYYHCCCYYYYYYYYYYDDNVQWCPVPADGWYGFRSSLGPLLANVFMSHIEEDLERESKPPSFYQRCVDDTLTIMPNMGT